jgi:putative membrane protein
MKELFLEQYKLIRAIHIIAVVAWYAGLFYIFRLFVYHVQNKKNAEISRVFEVMEAKLLRIIMIPASVLTLVTGLLLAYLLEGTFRSPWFHGKFLGVIFLFLYQGFAFRTHRRFARGDFFLTETQCRWINEVPTILLIWIVTLAVLKPWS